MAASRSVEIGRPRQPPDRPRRTARDRATRDPEAFAHCREPPRTSRMPGSQTDLPARGAGAAQESSQQWSRPASGQLEDHLRAFAKFARLVQKDAHELGAILHLRSCDIVLQLDGDLKAFGTLCAPLSQVARRCGRLTRNLSPPLRIGSHTAQRGAVGREMSCSPAGCSALRPRPGASARLLAVPSVGEPACFL